MLMRTDPFRDFDRLVQQVAGTPARPAAMPMDAYRNHDTFLVQFDLPGVGTDSIDLTVEKNVLTVHEAAESPCSGWPIPKKHSIRPAGSPRLRGPRCMPQFWKSPAMWMPPTAPT
jgi:HSP20 family protein